MHLQRQRIAGRRTLGWVAVLGALLTMVVSVSPAGAADSAAPVLAAGTFSAAPNGNNNWRITAPQTLNLSATDDVAVSKFQYSLDGGATYVDVPVTEGPSATAAISLSQEGNTTVRYRAVDSSGNFSRGATTNTTLNQASAAGATAIRLASTTGRSAGDELLIDTGAAQETATIATIVTPAPPSPAPNVTLTAPLANAHAAGVAVAGTRLYNTIALLIDTNGPVATWATQATTLQPNTATVGAPAAPGRHAAPAREHDRPRGRRRAPARPGRERRAGHDREHHHAHASGAGHERRADGRGDEDAPVRLGGVPAVDPGRHDPPVADADAAADGSTPARRDRHGLERRRRLRAPADDAGRRSS